MCSLSKVFGCEGFEIKNHVVYFESRYFLDVDFASSTFVLSKKKSTSVAQINSGLGCLEK